MQARYLRRDLGAVPGQDRSGVVDVTSKIAMDYTFLQFRPREILSWGDVVWGLFDVQARYQPLGQSRTSKIINLEIALRWQIKDGKIVEHQAFFDTASLLEQQGQLHEEEI